MLEGCGYLAYAHLPYPPCTAVVLSDPVAMLDPKAHGAAAAVDSVGGSSTEGGTGGWRQLVVAFLEVHPRAIFVHISERFGCLLRCEYV